MLPEETFSGVIAGHSSEEGVPATSASIRVRFAFGGLAEFMTCTMGGLGRGLSRSAGGLDLSFCKLLMSPL